MIVMVEPPENGGSAHHDLDRPARAATISRNVSGRSRTSGRDRKRGADDRSSVIMSMVCR
jgi:hypothetical protein